ATSADAGTAGAGAAAEGSPLAAPCPPDDLRRLRRREPEARSPEGGGGATAGGASGAVPARRRRRLREAPCVGASAVLSTVGADFLNTLAPTSPSAQSAPSAVWTSTRHTAIADCEP